MLGVDRLERIRACAEELWAEDYENLKTEKAAGSHGTDASPIVGRKLSYEEPADTDPSSNKAHPGRCVAVRRRRFNSEDAAHRRGAWREIRGASGTAQYRALAIPALGGEVTFAAAGPGARAVRSEGTRRGRRGGRNGRNGRRRGRSRGRGAVTHQAVTHRSAGTARTSTDPGRRPRGSSATRVRMIRRGNLPRCIEASRLVDDASPARRGIPSTPDRGPCPGAHSCG